MDALVTPAADQKAYRKGWWAWALYDVANSAFWLVIAAAVFPVYYQELYIQSQTTPGQVVTEEARRELATRGGSRLGYTAAIAMVIVAVLGPVLGAISDRIAAKKKLLAFFAGLGVVATGLMLFIGRGDVLFASVLYLLGTVGVAGSMVFYDALLPAVARRRTSTASPRSASRPATWEACCSSSPTCSCSRRPRSSG